MGRVRMTWKSMLNLSVLQRGTTDLTRQGLQWEIDFKKPICFAVSLWRQQTVGNFIFTFKPTLSPIFPLPLDIAPTLPGDRWVLPEPSWCSLPAPRSPCPRPTSTRPSAPPRYPPCRTEVWTARVLWEKQTFVCVLISGQNIKFWEIAADRHWMIFFKKKRTAAKVFLIPPSENISLITFFIWRYTRGLNESIFVCTT